MRDSESVYAKYISPENGQNQASGIGQNTMSRLEAYPAFNIEENKCPGWKRILPSTLKKINVPAGKPGSTVA